ncbi:MAG: terminase TerL endonuclease subunit, partial [Sphaerochaetaceae bacterium]
DWTALVACRVEDGAIFPIKVWNPEKYEGQIPREQVNATVEWCFGTYDVRAMRADVREFEAYIDKWTAKFGKKLKIKATPKHPIAFDMRGNRKQFTLDCERFEDAVIEGQIVHRGDPVLRQHILNAHRRPNNYGVAIGKASKDSSRKIDAAVCAILAYGARQELLMSKHNRSRKAVIFR